MKFTLKSIDNYTGGLTKLPIYLPGANPINCCQPRPGLVTVQEGKKALLTSAHHFVAYLTSRWPQAVESNLRYYLGGALGVMLLAQAEAYTELTPDSIPVIDRQRTIQIPETARVSLVDFARKTHDLDYVNVGPYTEYEPRLKRGGVGPSFAEIPDEGKIVFNIREGSYMLYCDPLGALIEHRIVAIQLGDKQFYITHPDVILAYKVVHILEGKGNTERADKFNRDFPALLRALRIILGESILMARTRQVLQSYDKCTRDSAEVHANGDKDRFAALLVGQTVKDMAGEVLSNPAIYPEIKEFIRSLNLEE